MYFSENMLWKLHQVPHHSWELRQQKPHQLEESEAFFYALLFET